MTGIGSVRGRSALEKTNLLLLHHILIFTPTTKIANQGDGFKRVQECILIRRACRERGANASRWLALKGEPALRSGLKLFGMSSNLYIKKKDVFSVEFNSNALPEEYIRNIKAETVKNYNPLGEGYFDEN